MLKPEAPYPQVGSYAIFIDPDPAQQRGHELARIQRLPVRGGEGILISLPLRDGASGTRTIDPSLLIDASPLSTEEVREHHDLDRALVGKSLRTPKQKAMKARRDALKQRIVYGPILDRLLRFNREASQPRWAA